MSRVVLSIPGADHRLGTGVVLKPQSVDIYLTYQCGLRCKHCFLGDDLGRRERYSLTDVQQIIDMAARDWGTTEITFLGGEPTLYRQIQEAVRYVQQRGLAARIVTNGMQSFARFMREFDGTVPPFVYFSVDGSTPAVHDAIRGPGAFEVIVPNIRRAVALGYPGAAILSVSRTNAADAKNVVHLCDELGLSHINVHYVTDRGYADISTVLDWDEWTAVCNDVIDSTAGRRIVARVDRSLVPRGTQTGYCAVRSGDSAMFLPDGRVFGCALLMEQPDAHSYVWSGGSLRANLLGGESRLVAASPDGECPAVRRFEPGRAEMAAQLGRSVGCVYEKLTARAGVTTIETAGTH